MKNYKRLYSELGRIYTNELSLEHTEVKKILSEKHKQPPYIKKLGISPKSKILDIGCATGLALYLKGVSRFIGIDISAPFLKFANAALKDCNFCLSDASKLPFKDNTFDFIFVLELIEHLPNYNESIKEIQRVLRKGGKVIITTPNKWRWIIFPFFYIMPEWVKTNILNLFKRKFSGHVKQRKIEMSFHTKQHIHEFSISEMKNLFTDNNFDIVEMVKFNRNGPYIERYIGRRKSFIFKPLIPKEGIRLIASKR